MTALIRSRAIRDSLDNVRIDGRTTGSPADVIDPGDRSSGIIRENDRLDLRRVWVHGRLMDFRKSRGADRIIPAESCFAGGSTGLHLVRETQRVQEIVSIRETQ